MKKVTLIFGGIKRLEELGKELLVKVNLGWKVEHLATYKDEDGLMWYACFIIRYEEDVEHKNELDENTAEKPEYYKYVLVNISDHMSRIKCKDISEVAATLKTSVEHVKELIKEADELNKQEERTGGNKLAPSYGGFNIEEI